MPPVFRKIICTVSILFATVLISDPPTAGQTGQPEVPWAEAERNVYPPGAIGRDYAPVFVPNGTTLPYRISEGVKVFHLTAKPVRHEIAPGLVVKTWAYNGSVPGPVIELVEGDRVRIYVTNKLPAPTTVHWHGVLLPSGMDGVTGLTQPPIKPGETFLYDFIFPHHGTFMYHPHFDSMTQEAMGLTGMIVVHPRDAGTARPERDFSLMLHEWKIVPGTSTPYTLEMVDFNVLTINGKAFPGTHPLVAQIGDRVRIRIGNLSAMSHHPIHLHGYAFKVVETDGGQIPESAQWPETTVLVPVGSVRVVEFLADNPGDWLMHCHMTHHMMNQMGHGLPNMIGVDTAGLDERIRRLLPEYMPMGKAGMGEMAGMRMRLPENAIPMLGMPGQFGYIDMGGMTSVLKVRQTVSGYEDPGWYEFPEGSVSRPAETEDLERDGISTE